MTTSNGKSAEQQARDMLERMGIDAQSMTAGDLVELANLIVAAGPKSILPSGDFTEEMRREFERWYMAEMCASETFERWLDTDYYEDTDVQKSWRGYQAAVATKQAELTATKQSEREGWRYSGELEQERKRLQAKIAEADKQEPVLWIMENGYDGFADEKRDSSRGYTKPLYARPPITSQRGLELLRVIEQMREAFQEVIRISDRKHDAWDKSKEALALTPDMTEGA